MTANLQMTVALGAAVVAAVGLALASTRPARGPVPSAEALPPPTASAMQAALPVDDDDAPLSGEVLETVPVSKYTYLRLRTSNGEVWAAVPSTSVAVGSHVAIANSTRMDDFKSATLKRTFKVIYFGNLASGTAEPPAPTFSPADVLPLDGDGRGLPSGHPNIDGPGAPPGPVNDSDPLPPGHPNIDGTGTGPGPVNDSDPLPPGHPNVDGPGMSDALSDSEPLPPGHSKADSPHGAVPSETASEPALPALRVEPARGSNAHVIGELTANRQKLSGQRVRVRGQVTKVTLHVQGHTFLHLRDGDPAHAGRLADLVVTTSAEPSRGQVVTFEGTLRADFDVGTGYKYPVLLEDGTLFQE